ncbi:hypothetical protein CK203_048650 [Vitis vinifera]|uniref:Uncharacterized protein n=1 Tax=Vitis vinifera TaxID=29760 RepID=A0A438GWJ8_VITVI|nr:hypothetical protein CK203_048650 [Vitis vinifera]
MLTEMLPRMRHARRGNVASEVANTGWGYGKSNTTLFGGGNGWSGGGSGG